MTTTSKNVTRSQFVQYCKAHNVDPKRARAKLRRMFASSHEMNTNWELNAKIRKIVDDMSPAKPARKSRRKS